MPPLPAECRRQIAHAAARIGDNAVIVLRLERGQVDLANDIIARCARFYSNVKAGLEGAD
jgi:hypothetical protein